MKDWLDKRPEPSAHRKTLDTFIKDSVAKHPKTPTLNPKDTAKDGGIADAYVIYSQLSDDAAHPSATLLNRYIVSHDPEPDIDIVERAITSLDERQETLQYACGAAFSVVSAVDEIVNGKPVDLELFGEFAALSAASNPKS